MNLKNKTFILTGASRIGKVVAKEMLAQGTNLVVSYLTTKPELNFEYNKEAVFFAQGDLSNPDDVKRLVLETKNKFGQLDGVVHMAATYNRTEWKDLDEQTWNDSLNTIAKSAFLLGKAAGDELLKNQGDPVMSENAQIGLVKGKIVLIADWSVFNRPYTNFVPYNVAKSAVMALTKSLAKELAPSILVNSVAPGPILKPANLTDEENAEVLKNTPVGHWGGAEEIAKAIMYLLDADFVTGQILFVDGGRSIA
jgi:pteridine reductase